MPAGTPPKLWDDPTNCPSSPRGLTPSSCQVPGDVPSSTPRRIPSWRSKRRSSRSRLSRLPTVEAMAAKRQGQAPSPVPVFAPPATRLYGTPRLTGQVRGERGARGPVWDHEVYVHSACETPKSCVFFPKEVCADPKGIPTAPPAAPAPPCPRAEEQDEAPELSTPQLPCPAPSGPGEIGLIIWGSEGRRGGGPKRGGESASFCPCHDISRP